MHSKALKASLDKHFKSIDKIILSRQDAVTGLLPASTAINAHGDYTDAWVRDNVYSIMSVWGLSMAYKKHYPNHQRTYILSHSVIKLMRGLLGAMMRQSDKVESFKKSLNPKDALHAKYGTKTALEVVGDGEWGHLQLDATSLFLLMIAQMTASGLHLIYSMDEVDFIQNLVHYISRTYCTPDYGIWERGNKINSGATEINSSSVGMAKAALEALDGFNLFKNVNSTEAVIHVVSSDIARSGVTLKALLPRESNSKETDSAILSIIGYPAYAVRDKELVDLTRKKIIKKLGGNYGCKRFLLDGHQSSIEDNTKLHYEASELKEFEHIESQWPLFFTYLLLDALMREDEGDIELYRRKLEPLFIEQDGMKLLPELYIVPKELIDAEKENPNTQKRVPNENLPLVWAQSLFILSDMIMDDILEITDIDPFNRRKIMYKKQNSNPMVSVIAENNFIKEKLANLGIQSQTLEDVKPIKIMHASELSKIHTLIGKNEKLSLSGRPPLVARTITTAKLYSINNEDILFLPYYFNPQGFYFSYDNKLLIEQFSDSIKFLTQYWNKRDQALMLFLVRKDMLINEDENIIVDFFHKIKTTTIEEALKTVQLESIENIKISNLELLSPNSRDSEDKITSSHDWALIRRFVDSEGSYDDRLEDALLDIFISHKRLAVGRSYSEKSTFTKPHESRYIVDIIKEFCGNNEAESVLTQELILHTGQLIQTEPELFNSMITIRPWYFVQLLVGRISREKSISFGDAYEILLSFAPSDIYNNLRTILKSLSAEASKLIELENLHASGLSNLDSIKITPLKSEPLEISDWTLWREEIGMLGKLPSSLYKDIWYLLQQCRGLIIGDKYNPKCRIGAELTLESTAGERNFALIVDNLLQNIYSSSYRRLNIEVIESLVKVFKANSNLRIDNDLILDVLIGYAVKIAWTKDKNIQNYDEQKGQAWEYFYTISPQETNKAFVEAFKYLLNIEELNHKVKI